MHNMICSPTSSSHLQLEEPKTCNMFHNECGILPRENRLSSYRNHKKGVGGTRALAHSIYMLYVILQTQRDKSSFKKHLRATKTSNENACNAKLLTALALELFWSSWWNTCYFYQSFPRQMCPWAENCSGKFKAVECKSASCWILHSSTNPANSSI